MASFRYVTPRLLAGALAGASFLSVGAWIVISGVRTPALRRTASFALGAIHLFAVAIPMVAVRFLNPHEAFSDLKIWGLSGPDFHRLSTSVYFVLLAATVFDLILAVRRKPKRLSDVQ